MVSGREGVGVHLGNVRRTCKYRSRPNAEFQFFLQSCSGIPAAFATAMISAVAAMPPACRGTTPKRSASPVRR